MKVRSATAVAIGMLAMVGLPGAPAADAVGTASISGRIFTTAGAPIATATIGTMEQLPAEVRADGTYTISGVSAGTLWFTVSAPGYRQRSANATAADGEQVTGVDVILTKTGTITGRVVDPAGGGIGGMLVRFIPLDGMWSGSGTSTTDGYFTVTDALRTGRLLFGADGGPQQWLDVDGVAGPDEFAMGEGELRDVGTQTIALADTTPPVVVCGVAPSVIELNQVAVVMPATATDNGATWAVSASLATNKVGLRSVVVSATDASGNVGSATCSYRVTYRFTGFGGQFSNSKINLVERNAKYDLKWRLADAAGVPVADAAAFKRFTATTHTCAAAETVRIDDKSTLAVGLQTPNAGKYRYTWKSPTTKATCQTLTVVLKDGTSHSVEIATR